MNAKDIEKQIKALYENVEPDHFEADDKKILRYDKQSIEFKERYESDPEFRKLFEKARAKRTNKWRKNVAKANKENPKFKRSKAYLESRERLKADPEWKRMCAEKNRALPNDPKWREAHLKSRAPIKDKNSTWRKNIVKANQKRGKLVATPGTTERENFMKGRENMKADPVWRRNVCISKGALPVVTPWGTFETLKLASKATEGKKWLPIQTPWGDFLNKSHASLASPEGITAKVVHNRIMRQEPGYKQLTEDTGFYTPKKIKIRIDKKVPGFYTISWAEYDKIKGITGLPQS